MWSKNIGEPLVAFWSKLIDTIHPADKDVLVRERHSLNIAYPPPAFIGDVRQARLFVLYANGGYDEERSLLEFEKSGSVEAYRERLRNPIPCNNDTHPYFMKQERFRILLEAGEAAVVNAMAYRSRRISKEPDNQAVAEKLPSVKFHRNWLRSDVIPALGKVMVVVHRPSLWKLDSKRDGSEFLFFTNASAYPHLPNWALDRAEAFLSGKKG